jgi:hypothetical protein
VRRIKKENSMLFMSIFTFDAAKREAIINRFALEGSKISPGVQVLMEVVDLSKNRAFRIFEATDPKAILKSNLSWNGFGEIETIPVIEAGEVLKTLERISGRERHVEVLKHSFELASLM